MQTQLKGRSGVRGGKSSESPQPGESQEMTVNSAARADPCPCGGTRLATHRYQNDLPRGHTTRRPPRPLIDSGCERRLRGEGNRTVFADAVLLRSRNPDRTRARRRLDPVASASMIFNDPQGILVRDMALAGYSGRARVCARDVGWAARIPLTVTRQLLVDLGIELPAVRDEHGPLLLPQRSERGFQPGGGRVRCPQSAPGRS